MGVSLEKSFAKRRLQKSPEVSSTATFLTVGRNNRVRYCPPPKHGQTKTRPGFNQPRLLPSQWPTQQSPSRAIAHGSRAGPCRAGSPRRGAASGSPSHRTAFPSEARAGAGRVREHQTSGRTGGGSVAEAGGRRRDAAPWALQHPLRAGPGPTARACRGRGLGRRREQLERPRLPRAVSRLRSVWDPRRRWRNKHQRRGSQKRLPSPLHDVQGRGGQEAGGPRGGGEPREGEQLRAWGVWTRRDGLVLRALDTAGARSVPARE